MVHAAVYAVSVSFLFVFFLAGAFGGAAPEGSGNGGASEVAAAGALPGPASQRILLPETQGNRLTSIRSLSSRRLALEAKALEVLGTIPGGGGDRL